MKHISVACIFSVECYVVQYVENCLSKIFQKQKKTSSQRKFVYDYVHQEGRKKIFYKYFVFLPF